MDRASVEFITKIVIPWNELVQQLTWQVAVEPGLSFFVSKIEDVAIKLSHYRETRGLKRRKKSLFNDIADQAKHGTLKEVSRTTEMYVVACFLCDGNGKFKFLRNSPFVSYTNVSNKVEIDFMAEALKEINALIDEFSIKAQKISTNALACQTSNWEDKVALTYNPELCILMENTRIKIFKLNELDELVPYDPPNWEFVVY